jgi:photosystem II stability/assembly factor-like uncharacterized protein
MFRCVGKMFMIGALAIVMGGCGGQFVDATKAEKEARNACTFRSQASMKQCLEDEKLKIAARKQREQSQAHDSWKQMSVGMHAPDPAGGATAVAIDPLHPNIVYAALPPRLYKSIDAGESWSMLNHSTALPPNTRADLAFLAIDPVAPDTIYATTRYMQMIKSIDGGITWLPTDTQARARWDNPEFWVLNFPNSLPQETTGLLFTSLNFNTLLWGTSGYAMKSIDGGTTWKALRKGLPPGSVRLSALATDPSNPATLYLGTDALGIWKSTDGGDHWEDLHRPMMPGIKALAVNPTNSSTVYAAGLFGISKSLDGGATWNMSNRGLIKGNTVYSLAIDPVASDTVYAGTFKGVFKSNDAGENWTEASTGLFPAERRADVNQVRMLAIHPADPNTIYAATTFGLYKTTRGGTP